MTGDAAERGVQALEAGDWATARDHLAAALAGAAGEDADLLDGMARALWWLGDVEGAVTHRRRAFTAMNRRADADAAARVAWWLVREYATVLANPSAANGWLRRLDRLATTGPTDGVRAWSALARCVLASDPAEELHHAITAHALAGDAGPPDLEVHALAHQGAARIALGDVQAGIADLDEALAAASVADAETVGDALCKLMVAVELVGDTERFAHWTAAVESYVERHHHVPLYGFCATCCGEVLADAGDWEAAEGFFRSAVDDLTASGWRARCAHPVGRLARLRIRQGRWEEAEELLAEFRGLPETVEPAAALHLGRGRPEAAARVLERRLAQLGEQNLAAMPLLGLLADACLARSDLTGAERARQQLDSMAERCGLEAVAGRAALVEGRILTARHRHREAARVLERAVRAFSAARLPAEAAVSRRDLARALAGESPEAATEEAREALRDFERLGATRDVDETAALLRELGVRGRTGPKGDGGLSRREQEVLALVSEGLTNAEIASRLFISTKTAGNHVSNVLMKLGVRSRTEAAAYALGQRRPSV